MLHSTRKKLMLLVMSFGLTSYIYAGKKKHQNKHQDKHQGQESKQSLDSLIAELKIHDEQKRKKEEEIQEKELLLEKQHLQKYPLTQFLGSSYKEPRELYNKRLIFTDSLMKKLGGLVHTYGLLIQNIGNQQKVLQSSAFTITDDEIIFSLSPQSAEGVALLHAAKPIINGIKTILHPKFRLKKFMPSFSFEKAKDFERIFQTCIQQNLNQDVQNIAKKLSIANRYYCFVAQEKQIIESHTKIAASIESCSIPGNEILEKNIYGLSGSVLSDYLKLHRRPDKVISLEYLKEYAETYSAAVVAIQRYHQNVLQELQSLAQELPVPKQPQQAPAESKQIHKKNKSKNSRAGEQAATTISNETKKFSSAEQGELKLTAGSKGENLSQEQISVKSHEGARPQQPQVMLYSEIASKHLDKVSSVTPIKPERVIKSYLESTVLNWFTNPSQALQRSRALYPNSNRTQKQQEENVIAHTYPFEMDDYVYALAAHKVQLEDDSMEYYIPGSIVHNQTKEEQTGYFSYVVTKKGLCVHRSFTLRNYTQDDFENYEHPMLLVDPKEEIFDRGPIVYESLQILQSNLAMHFITKNHTYKMCITK